MVSVQASGYSRVGPVVLACDGWACHTRRLGDFRDSAPNPCQKRRPLDYTFHPDPSPSAPPPCPRAPRLGIGRFLDDFRALGRTGQRVHRPGHRAAQVRDARLPRGPDLRHPRPRLRAHHADPVGGAAAGARRRRHRRLRRDRHRQDGRVRAAAGRSAAGRGDRHPRRRSATRGGPHARAGADADPRAGRPDRRRRAGLRLSRRRQQHGRLRRRADGAAIAGPGGGHPVRRRHARAA